MHLAASVRTALAVLPLLGGVGCSGTPEGSPDPSPAAGDLGASSSGVSTVSSHDFTDWSGRITVRVTQCDWTLPAQYPSATCPIAQASPTFSLVGGGAEVEGLGNPGALLTASYPDINTQSWIVKSKDHGSYYPHRLRAYSIGLQVQGFTPDALATHLLTPFGTSPLSERPEKQI